MAELEVIKHAKKGYKSLKDPHKHWTEKLKDIAIEIFIIVFAISLTLYFEHLAEKHHERQIAKEFLTGLNKDLRSDLKELSSDSAMYMMVQKGFAYFLKAEETNTLSKDSIERYYMTLWNTTQLQPNNSRFEGLRSSGNLDVIEDKELLNNILELYQEKIPSLMMVTNSFTRFKEEQLMPYLDENIVVSHTNESNLELLLHKPILQNYLRRGVGISEILDRYHSVLNQCRLIIHQIENQAG